MNGTGTTGGHTETAAFAQNRVNLGPSVPGAVFHKKWRRIGADRHADPALTAQGRCGLGDDTTRKDRFAC